MRAAVFLCVAIATQAQAATLAPAEWLTEGHVEFTTREGFPHGIMKILGDDGSAMLADGHFADGTISFDVKLMGDGIPGVRFRRHGSRSAEVFYLRSDPDCRAANDCIQYAPIVHGVMPWDMYPQYQSAAPVFPNEWNHIRLVVSGHRMNVFVNNLPSPTLSVGRLAGDTMDGGIVFTGPAAYANVSILPGVTDGLSPTPAPDPTAGDPKIVRSWQASLPATLAYGVAPKLAALQAVTDWETVPTEAQGLVNVSRLYGSPSDRTTGSVVWLRTHIVSDRAQTRHVSLAFLREVWVFANNKPVFAKENVYYPEQARLDPDGRLSLANGSFDLELQKGDNEIDIALNNILAVGHLHWGWGLEMRLDNVSGVTMPAIRGGR